MIVLAILGWLLLALVALLVLVLVLPIHLRLMAVAGPGFRFDVDLRLISARAPRLFRVGTGSQGRERPAGSAVSKQGKPARRKRRRKRPRGGGERPWLKRLIAQAPSAAGETLRAVRIDSLHAEGWFGLADPAETGQLWGWLSPLVFAVSCPVEVSVWPRFDRTGIGGEAEARLHFTFLRLVSPGLRLLLRVAPWRR
jgi:hypothetical protein